MKIAVLQLNFTVGDLEGNADKIITGYRDAVARGAELIVSTELALFGYPPKDLLVREEYLQEHDWQLKRLVAAVGDAPLVVGIVERNTGGGKPLYNSAAFIRSGRIEATQQKALLPTYDVFDEDRYFEPAPIGPRSFFDVGGRRVAMLVCEDIWKGAEDVGRTWSYQRDPVEGVEILQPDVLVVVNGSPYFWGKGNVRHELVAGIARKLGTTVVYANQVGGNDDLVFDGRSFVVGPQGRCLGAADAFEETTLFVDTDAEASAFYPFDENEMRDLHDALVLGTRDYLRKIGADNSGALVALSGGIDSAVTAAIAVEALGADRVMGVGLPSGFSSQGSKDDAQLLAENLGIEFQMVSIGDVYGAVGATVQPVIGWHAPGSREGDVTEENVQARVRGMIMMAFSNRTGRIVLTTGNKSEIAVGYCTLYGDMVGGFGVISDVPKLLVYDLARYVNRNSETIPVSTIEKPPSAELRPDQKDQDTLPPYEVLDPILHAYVEDELGAAEIIEQGFDEEVVRWVVRKVNGNEFKRKQMTVGPKVTGKAFGTGRRWPIAARFLG